MVRAGAVGSERPLSTVAVTTAHTTSPAFLERYEPPAAELLPQHEPRSPHSNLHRGGRESLGTRETPTYARCSLMVEP
jgi:hypothetical protein